MVRIAVGTQVLSNLWERIEEYHLFKSAPPDVACLPQKLLCNSSTPSLPAKQADACTKGCPLHHCWISCNVEIQRDRWNRNLQLLSGYYPLPDDLLDAELDLSGTLTGLLRKSRIPMCTSKRKLPYGNI
eukprot:2131536-Amphidinium_carterae.2